MHRCGAVWLGVIALVASAVVRPPTLAADEVSVPIDLQIQLLDRVTRYERTWAASSALAHVVIVDRRGQAESERVGAQVALQLTRAGALGGRAVEVRTLAYASASSLATEAAHADLVYLAAGLGGDVGAIAAALEGRAVLTVSAVGSDVDRGAVVGFELVSTRPRIAVNLRAARAQRLQFNASFLRLARVVE